jgi:hypothetical protein
MAAMMGKHSSLFFNSSARMAALLPEYRCLYFIPCGVCCQRLTARGEEIEKI